MELIGHLPQKFYHIPAYLRLMYCQGNKAEESKGTAF